MSDLNKYGYKVFLGSKTSFIQGHLVAPDRAAADDQFADLKTHARALIGPRQSLGFQLDQCEPGKCPNDLCNKA